MAKWSAPIQRDEAGHERKLIQVVAVYQGKIRFMWMEPEEKAREDSPVGADEISSQD
jgi:hypothetical protein